MSFADTVQHLFKQEIDSTSQSFKTLCPECDSNAWSMDRDEGKGSCFSCGAGKKGSSVGGSFAAWLSAHWLAAKNATNADEYQELQKLRRIPAAVFRNAGIARSPITGDWWLPTTPHFKRTGIKILRPLKLKSGEWKKRWTRLKGITDEDATGTSFLYQPMMSVASCQGVVYLTEGEWDALALWHLLEKEGEKNFCVVGSPGASSFNAGYARYFSGKPVVIVGQRDEAGQKFVEETATQVFSFAKSVASFDWNAFAPEGESPELNEKRSKRLWSEVKDVNDVLWAAPKDAGIFADTAAHTSIKSFGQRRAKIKRETVEEVFDDFRSYLKLTPAHQKMFRVILATFLSCKKKGAPIWLFVHGPSGCGKTEMMEAFSRHEKCFSVSRVTRASLVSGRPGENDPSIIPRLNYKMLAIKDYTVLLNMAPAELDGVNSIFRDVYDGSGSFMFGGQERSYKDIHFSTVACCTDAILRRNDTNLGERFMLLDALDRQRLDTRSIVSAAVKSARRGEAKFALRQLSQDGVAYLVDRIWNLYPDGPPEIPEAMEERIIDLAMIVTKLRAVVPEKGDGDARFREEVGGRVGSSMHNLLSYLSMGSMVREPGENEWNDLRSVARSSMNGWAFDICESIFLAGKNGATASEIAKRIVTTPEHVRRKLVNLKSVEAVRSKSMRSTGKTNEKVWFLEEDVLQYWHGSKLTTKDSIPSDLYRKRKLVGVGLESRPDRHLRIAPASSTNGKARKSKTA